MYIKISIVFTESNATGVPTADGGIGAVCLAVPSGYTTAAAHSLPQQVKTWHESCSQGAWPIYTCADRRAYAIADE